MRTMSQFLILIATVAAAIAHAAPIPLTSSSILISEKKGIFRSPLGFSLHSGQTNWEQVAAPQDNPFIATIYRANPSTSGIQAALTVRIDELNEKSNLESYSKKWLKDYPRFGFEILSSKKVRVGSQVAFLLDLVNRENQKQLRQVLFLKDKSAVTLTCRDQMKTFGTTLKSCNSIIRTFRWL
jgi:hypothetical protein